jgi:hypothetical protein
MKKGTRVALVLGALAVAMSCHAAPSAAASGNGKVQKIVTKIVTVRAGKKPGRPGKPVAAPEISAEGAAAAMLLTLGGIAVMTGRRRPV